MLGGRNLLRNPPALGEGIVVRSATIPSQGFGLFSTKKFERRDPVTWYDGFVVPKEDLWTEFLLYQPGSHTLTLDGSDYAVQGLQQPVNGWGAGSFINHRPVDLANCEYIVLSPKNHRLKYSLPPLDVDDQEFPMCVIVATRDIMPGEEFFCDYTPETCSILGIFYDHSSYYFK